MKSMWELNNLKPSLLFDMLVVPFSFCCGGGGGALIGKRFV